MTHSITAFKRFGIAEHAESASTTTIVTAKNTVVKQHKPLITSEPLQWLLDRTRKDARVRVYRASDSHGLRHSTLTNDTVVVQIYHAGSELALPIHDGLQFTESFRKQMLHDLKAKQLHKSAIKLLTANA